LRRVHSKRRKWLVGTEKKRSARTEVDMIFHLILGKKKRRKGNATWFHQRRVPSKLGGRKIRHYLLKKRGMKGNLTRKEKRIASDSSLIVKGKLGYISEFSMPAKRRGGKMCTCEKGGVA